MRSTREPNTSHIRQPLTRDARLLFAISVRVCMQGHEDRDSLVPEPPPATEETVSDPRLCPTAYVPPTAPRGTAAQQSSYLSPALRLVCVSAVGPAYASVSFFVSSTA